MSFVALAGAIGAGATSIGLSGAIAGALGTTAATVAPVIGAVGAGAIGGAGMGALGSAVTGGDVGKGALFGALGGGLTGGLSSAVGSIGGAAATPGAGALGSTGGTAAGSTGGTALGSSGSLIGQGATEVAKLAPALTNTSGSLAGGGSGLANPSLYQGVLNPTNVLGGNSLLSQGGANLVPTVSGSTGTAPISFVRELGGNLAGAVPANAGVGITNGTVTAANTGAVGSGSGFGTTALPQAGGVFGGSAAPSYAGTLFNQYGVPIVGAGAMLGNYLGGDSGPTQATPPNQGWSPLSYYKFNPRNFYPSRPTYINPGNRYANGGIASLTSPDPAMMQSGPAKVNFMGEDAYPTSQQKLNFYASPTQMPISAQQAMASYEPSTNPLTGEPSRHFARGGIADLGHYSDGGNLTRGPGDGVSDDIPATIAGKQPARLADGEFVVPARAVSELGNGSTEAGAKRLYAMVDQIQNKRRKSMGKKNIAVDSKARAALPV